MSNEETGTVSLWRVLSSEYYTDDPEHDVMALTVAASGHNYAVAISGPKGMRSIEFIPALQAACAALLMAVGEDPSIVGAKYHDPDDETFDTGNQRAN